MNNTVSITVEEKLCKTFKFVVPSNLDENEKMEFVENKIKKMYEASENKSILSSEDFVREFTEVQIKSEDGFATSWYNL